MTKLDIDRLHKVWMQQSPTRLSGRTFAWCVYMCQLADLPDFNGKSIGVAVPNMQNAKHQIRILMQAAEAYDTPIKQINPNELLIDNTLTVSFMLPQSNSKGKSIELTKDILFA